MAGRPPVITTVIAETTASFDSVAAAADHLFGIAQHGWMAEVEVYATSSRAFNRLRRILRERMLKVWLANSTVAHRHMAEASSWEDYFSEKEQRDDLGDRYDTAVRWLRYAGKKIPTINTGGQE